MPVRSWPVYKTRRADYARVRGIDLDGNEVVLEGSGLMGRMLQHECDHLDGHVYLDRLEKEERREGECVTCAPIASDRNSERRFNMGTSERRGPMVFLIFVAPIW